MDSVVLKIEISPHSGAAGIGVNVKFRIAEHWNVCFCEGGEGTNEVEEDITLPVDDDDIFKKEVFLCRREGGNDPGLTLRLQAKVAQADGTYETGWKWHDIGIEP